MSRPPATGSGGRLERRRFLAAVGAAAALGIAGRASPRDRFAPVVAYLHGLVEAGKLPFASVRVARWGQVLAEAHVAGLERIGPDSLYRIYSMTKPVVAAGVVLLVEEGRLSLDDAVARYVPGFADLEVLAGPPGRRRPARPMSVAQLLTHSCGLANSWGDARVAPLYRDAGLVAAQWMYDPDIGGLAGFAERLGRLPLEFQPGTDWLYGYGLDIAGLVIERVSGERLGAFLERRIFGPLGMAGTGFFVPGDRADSLTGLYVADAGTLARAGDASARAPLRRPFADAGSSGLVATLEDYGRFADMLANAGARAGVRVMAPGSVRLMTTAYGPQAPLQASLARFGNHAPGSVGQALGGIVRLDDRSAPGSAGEYGWGGAAGTGFWVQPGTGLSVTVMTQLMAGPGGSVRDVLRPLVYSAL